MTMCSKLLPARRRGNAAVVPIRRAPRVPRFRMPYLPIAMKNATLSSTPFLDWYGIWPSHRKLEEDGRIWSQSPPRGVRLRQEPAEKSPVFFHKERPWEQETNLGINTIIYEDGRYRLWVL